MTTKVEINPEEQAVYSIAQIKKLTDELAKLREDTRKREVTIRMLYADVKRLFNLLPFRNGSLDMIQVPMVIQKFMANPASLGDFSGIVKFIEEYEKTNPVVITK